MEKAYSIKLTLHIPHFAWEDGVLVEIDHYGFCEALAARLNAAGITDWYEIYASGRYKGRRYDQELWTLFFCEQELYDTAVDLFEKIFREWNDVMQQESFAYEQNGTLFVIDL